MAMVGVDSGSLQADSQPKSFVIGSFSIACANKTFGERVYGTH